MEIPPHALEVLAAARGRLRHLHPYIITGQHLATMVMCGECHASCVRNQIDAVRFPSKYVLSRTQSSRLHTTSPLAVDPSLITTLTSIRFRNMPHHHPKASCVERIGVYRVRRSGQTFSYSRNHRPRGSSRPSQVHVGVPREIILLQHTSQHESFHWSELEVSQTLVVSF
jgi:hypothetical protein